MSETLVNTAIIVCIVVISIVGIVFALVLFTILKAMWQERKKVTVTIWNNGKWIRHYFMQRF